MFLRTLAGRKGNHESALNECYSAKEQANRANNYGSSILWNILVSLDIVSIARDGRKWRKDDSRAEHDCLVPFLSFLSFLLSPFFSRYDERSEEKKKTKGEELAKKSKRNVGPLKVMYTEWLASRR